MLEEIGWLRILGAFAIIVGVVWIVSGMLFETKTIVRGLAIVIIGLFLRMVGGIWATLERIARK